MVVITVLGYAFGWNYSKKMALGMAVKLGYIGIYDDTSGTLARMDSSQSFMLDFGMILNLRKVGGLVLQSIILGIAINSTMQSTVGIAYCGERWTVAGEIDDLFAESTTLEDSLLEADCGLRYRRI